MVPFFMRAVVLFSGGLDSTTCLGLAIKQGFECHGLSFQYGQRHAVELLAAQRVIQTLPVASHHIIQLDPLPFSASYLTNAEQSLPAFQTTQGIAPTYVPARNTLFLAYALAYAEALSAEAIFIGVSAIDYSGYPDCRPEFIQAFQSLAHVATKSAVEGTPITIHAPLLHLSKAQTIQAGLSLGIDYALTVSCYQANDQGEACGKCDSCGLRRQGFLDAGVKDPTRYWSEV